MNTTPLPRELADHMEAFCLGELTAEIARRLEELVTSDPVNREHFVRFVMMHAAALRFEAVSPAAIAVPTETVPVPVPQEVPVVKKTRHRTNRLIKPIFWARLAAGLLFFGYFAGISWNMLAERERDWELTRETQHPSQSVATVRGSEDAEWKSAPAAEESHEQSDIRNPRSAFGIQHSEIAPGKPLNLASGLVELKLKKGVELFVEGPAEWTIDGENAATLKRGQLVAKVPPEATGFTLNTPTTRIVDLGTEFGASVSDAGGVQVHVFRGVVATTPLAIAAPDTRGSARLFAGQAIQVMDHGTVVRQIPANPKAFAKATPLPPIDAELVGFYPFDGNANDASGHGNDPLKVSGVTFVEGHEGQAALFEGTASSFIDLSINASVEAMPNLTWGAWVKPARAVTANSEILSTDNLGYDRILTIDGRSGGSSAGRFGFAAMAGPKVGVLLSQGPPPTPGQWTFVAAVYRRDSKLVMLYVEDPALGDGRGGLVTDFVGNAEIGPSLSTIRVGNHASGSEPFAGAIDNVFVFRGALGHNHLENFRAQGAAALFALLGDAHDLPAH